MRSSEASSVLAPPSPKPAAWGTGLVALDAVVSQEADLRLWAGGTCGNVLIILQYLGWSSFPISRLAADPASDVIVADMDGWGLKCKFLRLEPVADAPVIIHSVRRSRDGQAHHRFS